MCVCVISVWEGEERRVKLQLYICISYSNLASILHVVSILTSTVLFIVSGTSKYRLPWTGTHSTVCSWGGRETAIWGSCDDVGSTASHTGSPSHRVSHTLKLKLGGRGVPSTLGGGTSAGVVHDDRHPCVRVPSATISEAHDA